MKKVRIVFAALVCVLTFAACGGGGSASGPAKTTLVVASVAEPVTLDIQQADDMAGYPVLWRVYESLYASDTKGDLEPVLASGPAKQVEPTVWEVPLREGVTFHDGKPFNAKSAVFSIKRIIDPKLASNRAEILGVTGAEVVDDYTIRVTTKTPDFLLPRRLEFFSMLADGATDVGKKTNGTGPYKLDSYDSTTEAVLVANDEYWGTAPEIKKVTVKFIPDAATRVQALQSGEVDIAIGIPPDQASQVPKMIPFPKELLSGFVRLNTLNPQHVTSDVRVREALNLAIDREALAKSLYGDTAVPSSCQMGPEWAGGHNDALEPTPYDPQRAKDLISEAGAVGKTIHIQWPSGVYAQDRPLGEAVAQAWEKVGLKVDLQLQDFTKFSKAIYTAGPDVVDGIYADVKVGLAHSERIVPKFFYTGGVQSSYSNPAVDKLRTQASEATDDNEREATYDEIARTLCEDYAAVFMLYRRETLAVAKNVEYTPRVTNSAIIYYNEVKLTGSK